MGFHFEPIGIIHTPFTDPADMPIQSARSTVQGRVEVFAAFQEGLEGVEEFSHLYLLYAFHKLTQPLQLKIRPFLDDTIHGLFATRYPCRPNPLGLSVVRLLEREGSSLYVSGVDMLDGTPLLDIKPYIADFDIFPVQKSGWYQQRKHE